MKRLLAAVLVLMLYVCAIPVQALCVKSRCPY